MVRRKRLHPIPALGSYVYVLHFETPFKHAKHYVGWSTNLSYRLGHHRNGTGARLCQVVKENGGRWVVSALWESASRDDERKLKNRKETPRLCPVCTGHAHPCYDCGRVFRYPGWLRRHNCPNKGLTVPNEYGTVSV